MGKNPNVKLNALIRDVKCLTAPSALLSANNPIALHIAKHLNQNVNQSAKNLNVTGNAINLLALNLSANLFAKTLTVPKVECCPCALGAPKVAQPFPFFKEAEKNSECCQCPGKTSFLEVEATGPSHLSPTHTYANENPQFVAADRAAFNTMPSSTMVANGSHFVKVDRSSSVETLKNPVPLGPGLLRPEHNGDQGQKFDKARIRINLKRVHDDRRS